MVLITLTSENHNGNSFEVNFNQPIQITNDAKIALVSANIWFSWHNISSEYNNNKITYVDSNIQDHVITLPNGFYTLDLLDQYLQSLRVPFRITVNEITSRCILKVPQGISVDFTNGEIYKLLGFNKSIYIAASGNKKFEGSKPINITNGIDRILIHCSLVDGSYLNFNSQMDTSDIIYSFVPEAPPGSLIVVNPNPELIYLPIRDSVIRRIKMEITDQNNKKINLNNEPVTYMLNIIHL